MSRPSQLVDLFEQLRAGSRHLVVLTGAGISAESGIPTFRGEDGYWRKGSTVYQPMQLATAQQFAKDPALVWSWYLYRYAVCQAAQPNGAHRTLVEIESALPDQFTLVTQNVDGLHIRAGNSVASTLPIHGRIDQRRCVQACSAETFDVPDRFRNWTQNDQLDTATLQSELACPRCGSLTRPHILWFDECYDEQHYHFETALCRAANADQLWIIGTSGQTNLPRMLVQQAFELGTQLVELNPQPSDFSALVEASGGLSIRNLACAGLAPLLLTLNQDHPHVCTAN